MVRKVFISVLGATNYGECFYTMGNKKITEKPTRYIQEATLAYLIKEEEWNKDDVAYILLTEISKKKNWQDDGHKTKDGQIIVQPGLESCLKEMKSSFSIETIDALPDGNNEDEIWEIFERVFEKIQDGDELYFDLTHGFRYLPMLILVLGNYSKFLKGVKVRSITYGNYEGRNRETNEAAIIDLLPLSSLQDWASAAGQYLAYGNISKLKELCENEFKPILKETKGKDEDAKKLRTFVNKLEKVVEERQTCRGVSIIESKSFAELKNASNEINDTFISPLNPIIAKIKQSFVSFDDEENVRNGFSAAVWCFNNNLLQQSATILQEFVVSFICLRHNISIDDEDLRISVNKAFSIKMNNIPQDKWMVKDEGEKVKVVEILSDSLFGDKNFICAFNKLTEVRNDYNHSGMRSNRPPLKPANIKTQIRECINDVGVILFNVKAF